MTNFKVLNNDCDRKGQNKVYKASVFVALKQTRELINITSSVGKWAFCTNWSHDTKSAMLGAKRM